MKINQNLRPSIEQNRPETKTNQLGPQNFGIFVQKHGEKLQLQEFNRLISDIEVQGKRVSRSRTFRDLAKFKSIVKRFVEEAVDHGLDLSQESSWSLEGYSRTLNTVKEIDDKLIELTEAVLDKQRSSIDVLDKIGEIKGLLINLYI